MFIFIFLTGVTKNCTLNAYIGIENNMETWYTTVIEKFKSSPRDGLAALYEDYGKYLYQFSINNWGLDEDECYDTLYKTLEATGKVIDRYEFESESHFRNWLFKIHKNNI